MFSAKGLYHASVGVSIDGAWRHQFVDPFGDVYV